MDDRRAHFVVLVGNVCNDARTGSFAVEVVMDDGDTHSGLPDPRPGTDAGEEEVDGSGWAQQLRVGDAIIRLEDVHAIRVIGP